MPGIRLSVSTVNRFVKQAQYAVRGPIVLAASKMDKGAELFPADVMARAQKYISTVDSVGAYTESQGLLAVRQEVSNFLTLRDGHAATPINIFLTNGASEGVKSILQAIVRDNTRDAVLAPIPQYPLYSGTLALLNGTLLPYYLDESAGWACLSSNLDKSLQGGLAAGYNVRALVVINPGNPTGQVLTEERVREVAMWCKKNNVLLLADEVYQENIWDPNARFVSFRKAAYDLDLFADENPLQLISFHSVSKGFLGECGLRGGYFELLGIPPEVKLELYKLASLSLCSNVVGQLAVGLMVNPPKDGDESYAIFAAEKEAILSSMQRRARLLTDALNKLEGVSCNEIEGAMYAFPTITLPAKAIEAAKSINEEPDTFYCLRLVEQTGIVLVPGSGFGQKDGTWHFRATILPPENQMEDVTNLLTAFHASFLEKYKD